MDSLIGLYSFPCIQWGCLMPLLQYNTATDSLCYIRFVIDAVGYDLNASWCQLMPADASWMLEFPYWFCIHFLVFRGAAGIFKPPGLARGGLPFFHTQKKSYPPPPKLFQRCENSSMPFSGGLLCEIPLGNSSPVLNGLLMRLLIHLMLLDDTLTTWMTL